MKSKELIAIIDNNDLIEVGRKAIETALIEWRDERIFCTRNNGLVIKEKDGTSSSIIRFGPEIAIKIALKAMANKLDEEPISRGYGNNE